LPILRVHPPRGAVLEAVLWNSRRDETRSANVTLRFAYDLDAKVRAFRAAGYRRWVAARKRLIDGGKAIPAPLPGTFWLPDCGDGAVFSEVAQGIAHELG
jgi:hypothetical protein